MILVQNLPVPFDRRVWKECRALREAGYEVTAISPKGKGFDERSREVVDGVSIYRYTPFESSGRAWSYAIEYLVAVVMMTVRAWTVLLRHGFDVVQICNPPDVLIFVALPFKALGKAIIFDQHDLSPEIFAARNGGREAGLVYRALLLFEYITYRSSDVVVCITKSVCDVARTRGRVRDSDLFLVRNGPDPESFAAARPDAGLRRGKRLLVTYVGMMGPQDGVDTVLRVTSTLVSRFERRDLHVHLVGDGTELARLKAYADELGIREFVTFAGLQRYEGVVTAIASADVCVCPDPKTAMNDRANLVKVSEYMCLGRPIVAFDLAEVRYSAAGAAIYAEPGDELDFAAKVHHLLEHPQERARMSEIGKRRVRELLSWDHSKTALYAAYDRAFAIVSWSSAAEEASR